MRTSYPSGRTVEQLCAEAFEEGAQSVYIDMAFSEALLRQARENEMPSKEANGTCKWKKSYHELVRLVESLCLF